jgi:hypothetical protein
MVRDFFPIISGRDYFHQPQELGGYFQDQRCYYNDLRGKANWKGPYCNGVPTLYLPAWRKRITSPVMVLQYGLGNMDRFFLESDAACPSRIEAVTRWLVSSLNSQHFLDNHSSDLDPATIFLSNNSGMAQGEALSFLIRVLKYRPFEFQGDLAGQLKDQIVGIYQNMLLPLECQGTMLEREGDVYFCEFCEAGGNVILNGWIFAIFGLVDYCEWSRDSACRDCLQATLSTLKRRISAFLRPDGWSYYDEEGRICSPFYHALHISLFMALNKLTNDEEFGRAHDVMARANTIRHKVKYTLTKIADKLSDAGVYTSG